MMINKLFTACSLGLLMAFAIAGCSKDKFASKPTIEFKSISSYDIGHGDLFEIKLSYTDAEGDLSVGDSALVIQRSVVRCPNASLDFRYQLPPIPATKNSSGDIVIHFENGTNNYSSQGYGPYTPSTCQSLANIDTTSFRFYIKDKAGHTSDTISIDKPVLIHRQ